jgi:Mce-associated membrane protein
VEVADSRPTRALRVPRPLVSWPLPRSRVTGSHAPNPRVTGVVLVALGVLAVGLAVTAVVLGLKVRAADQEEARRQELLQSARQAGVNLMSLNYQTLERDIERILGGATGTFEDQYSRGRKVVERTLSQGKVVSRGEVLSAGIVNSDPDSAQVLVVVDQTVNNRWVNDKPVFYRISMTLVRQGDRWLLAEMEPL